nr:MAG TPA: hypothetical protein [Caudoviricetes sp.]
MRCGSSYPYFSHTFGKPCRGVWAYSRERIYSPSGD